MKVLLIGINAKYIHTNLAIRLLKANTTYKVDIHEFTIKDPLEDIVSYVKGYDYLGISTYIWNRLYIDKLIPILKETYPDLIIQVGGPEASYQVEHFIKDLKVDYLIRNEGEIAFDRLLHALIEHKTLEDIPNLCYQDKENFLMEISDLKALKSPYEIENDYPNRICYIETSRGCPYACSYCMASLEKKVRYFDINEVEKTLLDLMKKGTKVFKFLDRTFNSDKKKALEIFEFIIKNHYPNTVFQFEITGDILPEEIIDYLNQYAPKNLFRFEIGIQSTNKETNQLIHRIQNEEKLFHNIRKIQEGGIIDLHLDLICGLPKEDISSFEKTFNDVFSLRPLELQLGFLKLLRGTKMYDDSHLYNYTFMEQSPYEVIENDSLSKKDIFQIHQAEQILEKYYNSHFMPKTMTYLLDHEKSPFGFFKDFGLYFEANYSFIQYDLCDLFHHLYQYLALKSYSQLDAIEFLMKEDYLTHFKMKPKLWWTKNPNRKEIIKEIVQKNLTPYNSDDLFRYGLVETYKQEILLAFYKPNSTKIIKIKR